MAESTTIIFVPGAWHTPDCYDLVIEVLENDGYKTDKVHLASVGAAQHLQDFGPDVAIIRSHIVKAVDAGQKVVVVAHSYGGIPSNQAIEGLDYDTRQGAGQPGGVTHMFLCCSFVLPEGKSLLGAFGGDVLPWFDVSEDRTEVNPKDPAQKFYNDMADDQVEGALAAIKPHCFQTFLSPVTFAAWRVVPSTYLYTANDQATPLHVQKMMVEEWAKDAPFRTETLDASHSPFLSMPVETAAAIRRAAEA